MDRLASPSKMFSSRLPFLAWLLIVASCCAVFFGNLRFGRDALGVGWEDDFYYYSQVARNLALHGVSTFDGIHLTNGYHPLWMAVIAVLTLLFDVNGLSHSTTQLPFILALETLQCVLVIGIAYLVSLLCRICCSVVVSCGVQLLIASIALILVRTGMEVGLTIALAFALLWFRLRPNFQWSPQGCFCYGLLGGIMVLSRLDSILLVGLLFFFDVLPNASDLLSGVKGSLWFSIGMLPVAGYLLLNEVIFDVLMPVSGTAKQMRAHKVPSLHAAFAFAGFFLEPKRFAFALCAVAVLAALFLLVTGRDTVASSRRGVFWAVMLFPFVHFVAIISMSDWNVWQWYLYAWPIAGVLAAMMIAPAGGSWMEGARARVELGFAGFAFAALCGIAGVLVYASNPKKDLTYVAALQIAEFAKSHPGIYAMGDRAGAVGYMAGVPVIQLEGLMMDKAYLDNIRQQRNLVDVLKDYNVRYYISTRSAPDAQGCYPVKEPWQAGPSSPAMYGLICKTPVAEITHGAFVNDIFDMK